MILIDEKTTKQRAEEASKQNKLLFDHFLIHLL